MLAYSNFIKKHTAVFMGNEILCQIPFTTNQIMLNMIYLLLQGITELH